MSQLTKQQLQAENNNSFPNNTTGYITPAALRGYNVDTIDSFALSLYRSADYKIQISRGSEYYYSKISVLTDGTNINVSESDMISNTDSNLANITFEENSGIISLCVTPVSSAVTVRYFRTALKA